MKTYLKPHLGALYKLPRRKENTLHKSFNRCTEMTLSWIQENKKRTRLTKFLIIFCIFVNSAAVRTVHLLKLILCFRSTDFLSMELRLMNRKIFCIILKACQH